jgi:hypothetical protein
MRKLILFLTASVLFATAASSALGAGTPITGATGSPGPVGPSSNRAHVHWFAGSVSLVGTSSLMVGVLWTGPNDGVLNGQTVAVTVADHTRINGPRAKPIALAQIQVGDLVAVRAVADDAGNLTARLIRDRCNCHWIGGTIGSIGTTSFTVNVERTGPFDTVLNGTTVTLQVNADTVYLHGPRRGRIGFSDLEPGEGVGVVFGANGFFKAPGFDPTTATFTAKRVHVWPNRFVPPASSDAGAAASVST